MTEQQPTLDLDATANVPAVRPPDADTQTGSKALTDLRTVSMMLPVKDQQVALTEYITRRKSFREWLLEQLVAGLHYGYPPGTEPKYDDAGNMVVKGNVVPREQWRKVPSLYQAGADFVCDLMGLRHEFEADPEAWQMMGGKEFNFVYRCRLFSRQTGEVTGEGHGASKAADHGGKVNTAIKMACKRAKVAAVINAYGLSDLFTQDLEDGGKEPHPKPEENDDAPKAKPRGERDAPELDAESIGILVGTWRNKNGKSSMLTTGSPEHKAQRQEFFHWVTQSTGRDFDPSIVETWTMDDYNKCCDALGVKF